MIQARTAHEHIVVLRLFSIIRGYQRSSAIKSFLSTHSYKTLENAELKVLKVKFSTRRKRKNPSKNAIMAHSKAAKNPWLWHE